MTVFFPYLPEFISQIDSTGYASLGYQLTGVFGSFRRCLESHTISSAASRSLLTLPNGAKFDPNQTYDAPTTMGQFDITWTLFAMADVSVTNALAQWQSDLSGLAYFPYSRVRIYASDSARMWYLNTRGIGIKTTIQGNTPRILRVTATFDPIINYWQEGGPSTAS
jgi:hypothetical protein